MNDDGRGDAPLDPAEDSLELLRQSNGSHAEGWATFVSMISLLRRWTAVVDGLTTFDGGLPQYAENLRVRDELAAALAGGSGRFVEQLGALVGEVDARFQQVTVPDDGRLAAAVPVPEAPSWWWERRPASGPLATLLD